VSGGRALVASAALIAAGAGACAPSTAGKNGGADARGGVGSVEAGAFRPVAMRAHPLTRIIRENGAPVRVEAHAEFFDRWGHTVKALGTLRFELEGVADGGASPVRWEPIDLSRPGASSRAHDPATGTYWVRLELPAGTRLGGSPTLRVVFTSSEGVRMSSSIELE